MGASRSCVYEISNEVVAFLPTLVRPPGRPRAEREPHHYLVVELPAQACDFVMSIPAVFSAGRARTLRRYRRFVIDYANNTPTSRRWRMSQPRSACRSGHGGLEAEAPVEERAADADDEAPRGRARCEARADRDRARRMARMERRLQLVLRARASRPPDRIGKTMIARILFEHGERTPARRGGRSRDEEALRNTFETFFPGAQWVGDGKQLEVVIDGKIHVNLELIVDAASAAAVGISVRDEEDSAAVVEAFDQGKQTTREPPLALLLDNRPSNHTAEVDAALDDTMRIRATPYRPENKAHVEGAFGLFAQKVPSIELDTRNPCTLAKTIARLVATTFFRALNRAPRRDRDGKTRTELYGQRVTPEEREADAWRCKNACASKNSRDRRVKLASILSFARSSTSLRPSLPTQPRAPLPRCHRLLSTRHHRRVDRDLHRQAQRRHVTRRRRCSISSRHRQERPPRPRGRAHHRGADPGATRCSRPIPRAARRRTRHDIAAGTDVGVTLIALVDRLVLAERTIDRHVWLDAATGLLAPREHTERVTLAQRAARWIHAAFRCSPRDRDHLVRSLLRRLWPLK